VQVRDKMGKTRTKQITGKKRLKKKFLELLKLRKRKSFILKQQGFILTLISITLLLL
jgi:hypothetical protein